MSTFAVIMPAAGQSSRFRHKHYKKPFAPLNDRAVWLHAADRFLQRDDVKQVIMVISPEDREDFYSKFGANIAILGVDVVEGGATRSDSVANGLAEVKPEIDFVAVHDAARPCLANEWIDQVFAKAEETGAAMLAIPVRGTLKRVRGDQTIEETISRDGIWEAQTPQVFRRQLLIDAYAQAGSEPATDDAQIVERRGQAVTVVEGSPINMKITTTGDLRLAQEALKALPKPRLDSPGHPFADGDLWR